MTSPTKQPKAKFSSRNLSAVFKAPLRTKPLPDHATGPLPRTNGRLLVLGKAAAPAPVNTPSLRKESQVHDVRVSLVPASSNWATNAAVLTEKPVEEPKDVEPAPAEPAVQSSVNEKVWTPQSVAEHLHTTPAVRPTAIGSGRWGDDAVENDIVQTNLRLQRQRERDFPDLKEAIEEQPHYGHAAAAESRSPSMEPQEHRPRATGRWAHFSEEMRRPMQDGRDRHDEDRWGRSRYSREDDRWSRDRYSRDEDDRSRDRYSRFDDEYGREPRRYGPAQGSRMVSPIPNDSRTHFSSSDARFDMLVSGDSVLSHSPHRMDWSRRSLGRSSSPASPYGSRIHNVEQNRAQASPSPSPTTPTLTTAATPARPHPWRHLSPTRRDSPSPAPNAWRKTEEDDTPSTPVATADESSTESSSNSSASSSPIPAQQVQLLKRSKMLFDPKTGAMVHADDEATSGKKPIGGRTGGRGRGVQKDISTNSKQAHMAPAAKRLENAEGATDEMVDTQLAASTEKDSVEEAFAGKESVKATVCEGETPSSFSVEDSTLVDNADNSAEVSKAKAKGRKVQRERGGRNRAEQRPPTLEKNTDAESSNPWKKQSVQQTQRRQSSQKTLSDSQQTKATSSIPERDSSQTRGGKAAEQETQTRRKQRKVKDDSTRRSSQRPAGRRQIKAATTEVQQPKVSDAEVALLKQIADGSNGGVVVVTGVQEGIEVHSEDGEFETVKSRRALLAEKKQIRQRLNSAEAQQRKQSFAKRSKSEQSKSEEVEENFGFDSSAKTFAGKKSSRGASNDKAARSAKHSPRQPKHSPEATESKEKQESADDDAVRKVRVTKREPRQKSMKARGSADRETTTASKLPASPAKPTEQVAGEAAAESPMAKSVNDEKKRGQQKSWVEKQFSKGPTHSSNASSAAGAKRQPGGGKRGKSTGRITEKGADTFAKDPETATTKKTVTTKPRAAASKARPKQVKQVYVVKTPAPSTAAATSTAA